METIRNLISTAFEKLSGAINGLAQFLGTLDPSIYGFIIVGAAFVAILVIAGLITLLKSHLKFTIILIVILAVLGAACLLIFKI